VSGRTLLRLLRATQVLPAGAVRVCQITAVRAPRRSRPEGATLA
jgi:hypothetical protein